VSTTLDFSLGAIFSDTISTLGQMLESNRGSVRWHGCGVAHAFGGFMEHSGLGFTFAFIDLCDGDKA